MNEQLCLPAPKLTPQDVFNKAWQAFVVEKKPASFDPQSSKCLYRGANGSQCAFGLCLPDHVYSPKMEGKAASQLIRLHPEVAALFRTDDGPTAQASDEWMYDSIQAAHDHSTMYGGEFTVKVERQLRAIANRYDLTIPTTNAA
jgi:hypothetical protein